MGSRTPIAVDSWMIDKVGSALQDIQVYCAGDSGQRSGKRDAGLEDAGDWRW